jgi:EAL and modified HD-GYP domain-containing signal transduction protein
VHVPIPHDILRSGYVELLPANYVVLTIAPDEEPWLLDRCKELAAAGYQLSVDLGSASPSVEFLSLCRYARVSVQDADIDALRERVRGLRRHTRLIATGVDTREHSTIAKELLINYYRGYYFAIPRPLGGRSLSPGERLVSRVISQLTQRAEPSEVEATVKQDVGLSYQLLRYVNSAGHGLRTQVTSLRQALTLLGHERLLRWVSVYLLSRGKDSPGEGHDALYAVSLRRGRTMELLGEGRKTAPECELLFLIGMFSLLDLLLQVPLEETLTEMGLPEPVTRTLVERNGPLTDYLDLTLAMERADMVEARSKMSLLRMEPAEVNRVQLDAMAWVECIVQGRDKEERTAA